MTMTKQQVLDGFHYRASTRSYDPTRKISDEDFNYILELGRLSPSSVGSEPWQFLVIQNKALREKLKPVSWGMATFGYRAKQIKPRLRQPMEKIVKWIE